MTRSPSRTQNPLLAAALAYAARGWRVFPLIPHDKKPLTPRGFHDASTNRNTILQWWQAVPDANIGLACGDPFDVLDLDDLGDTEGMQVLRGLVGPDYVHTGPVVLTGKGAHYYFAATGGGNRAKLLGRKIDFRGNGGYVVAPPSLHPSGRTYRWAQGRDAGNALPVVPATLGEALAKPTAPPTANPPQAIIKSQRHGGNTVVLNISADRKLQRAQNPILQVAQDLGLTIYPKGAHWVTNCIFHEDPGPSLVLYERDNTFFCFGCEARGDSLDLKVKVDMRMTHARFLPS